MEGIVYKHYLDMINLKMDRTPYLPVPIYTPSPSPGENSLQPDIGAVRPFSEKGAEKAEKAFYFSQKSPDLSKKSGKQLGWEQNECYFSRGSLENLEYDDLHLSCDVHTGYFAIKKSASLIERRD